MKARDVMTTDVAVANPDTPTSEIAALLLRRGISAIPIVDAGGAPIGMVSEGDMLGRETTTVRLDATGGSRCWPRGTRSTKIFSPTCAHPNAEPARSCRRRW